MLEERAREKEHGIVGLCEQFSGVNTKREIRTGRRSGQGKGKAREAGRAQIMWNKEMI